jgi:16S rRNA (cytidine1402-2'-O)-methyltransferase
VAGVVLVVCGVPIGNLADAGPRLAATLAGADVLAAEDTRRLRRLCAELGVVPTGRVVSCYEAVEEARLPGLLAELRAGSTVALLTDAGMPAVSDPGFRLVAAAAAEGLAVTVVPGPSAVTAAVAVSGLPSDRFVFEGFLPRRQGERRRRLSELAGERRTLVLLEARHRIAAALADLAAVFGPDRPAVLCRELTKTHEELLRGSLADLAAVARERDLRGEITLVVAGAPAAPAGRPPEAAQLASRVAELEAGGLDRRAATVQVAAESGLSRRAVFDALVAVKRPGGAPGPA